MCHSFHTRLRSDSHAVVWCLVKITKVGGEKGPWTSPCCATVSSTRMVRRGGSPTTAAWISQRWSGRTKMTLYVKPVSANVAYIWFHIDCACWYRSAPFRGALFLQTVQLYQQLEQWPSTNFSAPLRFLLQLRNAMVNRRTGTFSMEVKKTVDRGVNMFSISLPSHWCPPESELSLFLAPVCFQRRVLKMHNDYYFTDIKGTPFRWSQTSLSR